MQATAGKFLIYLITLVLFTLTSETVGHLCAITTKSSHTGTQTASAACVNPARSTARMCTHMVARSMSYCVSEIRRSRLAALSRLTQQHMRDRLHALQASLS